MLFVNAGVAEFRPLEQWDEAGFDRSLAVNLKGPFFLVQALLPILANPASIVLNTSINARIGMPNSSVYAATKAGLLSLARTLSGELIGRGIRVNAVSPGPIATPLYGKLGLDEADVDAMSAALLRPDSGRPLRQPVRDRRGRRLPRLGRVRVHRRQRAHHRRRHEQLMKIVPRTWRN